MYNIQSDRVSYLIPMDYIDLGYLKGNMQMEEKVRPLWTPNQKEYSTFQLIAWRKDGENSDKYVTTICHICNIPVPVIFLKEHNNSKKHKGFVKIIYEALERVRKNMNVDVVSTPKHDLSPSARFCDVCNEILPKNDEETHENLIIHKVMQRQEELIESFLRFFDRADAVSDDSNNNRNMSKVNGVNENYIKHKNVTQLELIKNYIDTLNKKYSASIKIEVVDESFISLKVQDGTLKVHIDDFNSFNSLYKDCKSDTEVVCLLCKIVVTSKDTHMWTDTHMKNVMKPISDEHCIRHVNQGHGHCIICNELIKNISDHRMEFIHKKKLKLAHVINDATFIQTQALVRQTKDTVKLPEVNKAATNMSVTNASKEKTQTLVTTKDSTPKPPFKHANSLPSNEVKKDNPTVIKQTEPSIPKLPEPKNILNNKAKTNVNTEMNMDLPHDDKPSLHYMMCGTPNPKELLCRVCLCVVPGTVNNVYDHLHGIKHENKYCEFLSNNKLQKVENGFACTYCILHVPEKTEIQHVLSQNHKVNVENKCNVMLDVTYCEVCLVFIHTHNIEDHRNGQKHLKKKKIIAKNGIVEEGHQKSSYAAVTTKTVNVPLNTTQNIVNSPISVTNSVQSMDQLKNVQTTSPEVKSPQPLTSHVDDTQLSPIIYQFKQTSTQNTLLCRVCKVNVPNTTDNITTHVNGSNHTKQYKELLTTNKVTKEQHSFHCHKCDVKITSKNELCHIFGRRHINMPESDIASTVSDISNYSGTNDTPTANKITTNHVNQPSKMELQNSAVHVSKDMYEYLMEPLNTNALYCKVCEVKVPNVPGNISTHIKGFNHTTTYNDLLVRNMIYKFDSHFFCDACRLRLPLRRELNHLKELTHIDCLQTHFCNDTKSDSSLDTNMFFCEFCLLYVDDGIETFEEHQISTKHVNNIHYNVQQNA